MHVKYGGGILSRLTIAVGSFHAEHQTWPDKLRISQSFWEALSNTHLTEAGVNRLKTLLEIELISEPDMCIVLSDRQGRVYSYYERGMHEKYNTGDVDEWLGFV